MVRLTIPIVEVTAPDGTKSFWVAYSIPHDQALAAVRSQIPDDHMVELSIRRLPPGWKFHGARPQDIIKLEYGDANSERSPKRVKSARSAGRRGRIAKSDENPEKMAAKLLAAIRKMPPGPKRLREIERLRRRMHSLLRFGVMPQQRRAQLKRIQQKAVRELFLE
jgi:hypothetical protein